MEPVDEVLLDAVAGGGGGVAHAFAYGSGAFSQPGAPSPPSMVDYVLAVPDPAAFHGRNMEANPSHYGRRAR
eukprot:CAMPEP_0183789602 /NCGR_PEP_ID=MMETSP0803_2-20130417/525_1 /TAXON_ID=195967 /ORGANISM="Crustomastix stigmata, Strain CCMP3273" /LENGTH=71 /DNA_ID=CAMNT_0026033777 /DNA_START=31 /DNA_END=243 /DNA_ORIENTATION=-